MRFRLLLALLFCLTAWAALAQFVPASRDEATNTAAAGVGSETETGAPGRTGDSDSRWEAGGRAGVSVTESLWRSSVIHAHLAGARLGEGFIETHDVDRRNRLARHASPHLVQIPLLI